MTGLVPDDFTLPLRLECPDFTLRPLRIADVVKDYDAVISSRGRLAGLFGPGSEWPGEDLSLEQNLIDLGWHHKEFQRRTSFAFTVESPDAAHCLGCAYIYPSRLADYDAAAYCWVRASAAELDAVLYAAFKGWLQRAWPFRRLAFPGRDVPFGAFGG